MSMKTNFDTVYVHYGSDEFNRAQVVISASDWNKVLIGKPNGLWASPVDAREGWKDWCEGAGFHLDTLDKHFKFKLKDTARILEVHKIEDILLYVREHHLGWRLWYDGKSINVYLDNQAQN